MSAWVRCSHCGATVGRYVAVNTGGRKQIWIEIGGVRLSNAHGQCAVCGHEWHFAPSRKPADELLTRAQKREEQWKHLAAWYIMEMRNARSNALTRHVIRPKPVA